MPGQTGCANWSLNGAAVVGGGTIGNPGNGWTAKASGDFTGTGETDILFQNPQGTLMLWQTDGAHLLGNGTLGNATPWNFVGTGDFNGDGKLDILFESGGQLSEWLMSGPNILLGGGPIFADPGDFVVVGTGDFNGDGRSDILFRDPTFGAYAYWTMNGAQFLGGGLVGLPGANWSLSGTGDFNGDGVSDLLFQNAITGDYAIWDYDGTSGGGTLGKPGGSWALAKIVDLNGDGRSDLVFKDAGGQYATWFLNDTTVIGGGTFGAASSDWHLV